MYLMYKFIKSYMSTRTSKGDYTKPQQAYGTINHVKKND